MVAQSGSYNQDCRGRFGRANPSNVRTGQFGRDFPGRRAKFGRRSASPTMRFLARKLA